MVAASEEPTRRPRLTSPAEKRTALPSSSNDHRRRSLHNFSFPPSLSWGNQRVLRCVNLTPSSGKLTATTPDIHRPESESEPKPKRVEEDPDSSPASRPWNLRTRRSNPNRISNPDNPNPHSSPNLKRSESSPPPSPELLEMEKGNLVKLERSEGERCEFAVALRREEIEEDFVSMKGTKPNRRPKKRAKYIQKQLDTLFPGLCLSEITPDLYKIDIETLEA